MPLKLITCSSVGVQSIVYVDLAVCLFVCLLAYLENQTSEF